MGRHAPTREVRFTSKKRGLMKAMFRLAIAAMMTGLTLGAAPARAQDPAPVTTDQVGPRELQDFNLQGTVTRPAAPPTEAPQSNRTAPATRPATDPATSSSPRPSPDSVAERRPPAPNAGSEAGQAGRPTPAPSQTAIRPNSSVTVQLPPVDDSPIDSSFGDEPPAPAPTMPGPANDVPLPWLFVAALLVAGAGVYFWRSRRRQAIAGGADYDSFEAYQPAPTPTPPAPAPAGRGVAPDPDLIGVVSTRLRPWLEIAFRPLRCKIDDNNVTFEFELGLFNSGSTPARAILVEASYFNAGESQGREIEQFFANPVGAGERAVSLAPLKRMVITTKVVTPRTHVREYEAGGRRVFVPLIGFNALYSWGSGEGQTSASFMLGRKTKGEKLAPFRLDMVDREFRALDKRELPTAVRH